MSYGDRIPIESARKLAQVIIQALERACERIEIAGSIRRGKSYVGDIEIVCIPRYQTVQQYDLFGQAVGQGEVMNRIDAPLRDLLESHRITKRPPVPPSNWRGAWGDRYRKFYVAVDGPVVTDSSTVFQVDLFMTTPETWGSIFTIRTGPGAFSKKLVTHALVSHQYRQQDGGLYDVSTGKLVPTPEETDYFRALGLMVIPPEQRDRKDAFTLCCDVRTVLKDQIKAVLKNGPKTYRALQLRFPKRSVDPREFRRALFDLEGSGVIVSRQATYYLATETPLPPLSTPEKPAPAPESPTTTGETDGEWIPGQRVIIMAGFADWTGVVVGRRGSKPPRYAVRILDLPGEQIGIYDRNELSSPGTPNRVDDQTVRAYIRARIEERAGIAA